MSLPEKPTGRVETYLASIAGQNVELPVVPTGRMETYLAKIAGQDVIIPDKPISRREKYLAKIAGQTITLPNTPIGREESYLAKIAGETVDIPAYPISRIEAYLEEIANGGILRDKLIIPDKYNCGYKGTLTKFDHTTDTSGLSWRLDNNQLVLDFNVQYRMTVWNLGDDGVAVLENLDFTDYSSLGINNASKYVETATYYRSNITIIFKNCLFKNVGANEAFSSADIIHFKFDNCSFMGFSVSNSEVENCSFGNATYYKSEYSLTRTDDAINPKNYSSYKNCYIYDVEAEAESQGTKHIDGVQTSTSADDIHFYNCRFECFDMPYQYSPGEWSYAIFWEAVNTNSSFEYNIIHGGGYYQTSIKKGNTNTVQNNFIAKNYSSPCYPGTDKYQMTDDWAEYIDTLLVSSIWVEEGKIKIVCSNDMTEAKQLKVVTDENQEYTFNIEACPSRSDAYQSITEWADLPYDRIFEINVDGVNRIECYDGETKIRTFAVNP
jgi:hypothetical protein